MNKKLIRLFAIIAIIGLLFSNSVFAVEVDDEEDVEEAEVVIATDVNNTVTNSSMVISSNPNSNTVDIDDYEDDSYYDDYEDGYYDDWADDYTSYNSSGVNYDSLELHDGDYYNFGNVVSVNNITMDGNMFVAGSKVVINNVSINGNVFVAAEDVEIRNANIEASLFVAGNNVNVIGYDAVQVYAAGNNVTLNGEVWRDIRVAGNNVVLAGNINRSVFAGAEKLVIQDCYIADTLDYTSEHEAEIDSVSEIGNTTFHKEATNTKATENFVDNTKMISCVTFIVLTGVLSALYLFVFKKFVTVSCSEETVKLGLKSFGIGFLGLVAVPIAAVLLLMGVVTIPISLVALLVYVVVLMIASASAVLMYTYNLLANKYDLTKSNDKLRFWALSLLIAACAWLVQALPIIGILIRFILFVSGIGAIVRTFYINTSKLKEKNIAKVEEAKVVDKEEK